MIHFVATRPHRYTLRRLLRGELGSVRFRHRFWSYERLINTVTLPTGTWIFLDIERLTDHESFIAGAIATRLESSGAKVLNHPAHVLDRYGLQRALYRRGINTFETFRADEHRYPNQWPVFVRPASDHKEHDGELLYDADQLDSALYAWQRAGVPLRCLLIIEYCGEPATDGLWRKYSAYRVGDELIPHHIVKQNGWVAKFGDFGGTPGKALMQAVREEEYGYVYGPDDRYLVRHAFDAGHIEFGRIDHGVVDGRAEVYEINTNPMIGDFSDNTDLYPELPRQPMVAYANGRILNALKHLDTKGPGRVSVRDLNFRRSIPFLRKKRR